MNNPWLDLPKEAPFIAPCDAEELSKPKYNEREFNYRLQHKAFPEPYVGNMSRAKIILLLLNPGFEEADITTNFKNTYWVNEIRANLEQKTEFSFLYLSPQVQETGGYKWWTAMLKPLEAAGVTRDELANGLMSIQFLAYHSKKYKHDKHHLPTQDYQFHLVEEAMKLNKTIIIMRSRRKWVEAIPELAGYRHLLELNNPLRVYVSRANLDNKNGDGTFDKVVATLKERE
jgi:hypothetical protein